MRHASGHNYRNSSFIVDVAMGQIPRSAERISSLQCNYSQQRRKQTRIGMASIPFLLPFLPLLFSFFPLASFPSFLPSTHPRPSPSLHPSLSLRSRTPQIQLGGLGSAVSSPSSVWGRAPAEIDFGAF